MTHESLVYTNQTYKKLLLTVVGFLFVINLMAFLFGYFLSVLPLLLQGSILIAYFKKWPQQRILIMVWSSFLVIIGVVGLIITFFAVLANLLKESATLKRYISLTAVVYQLVCLVVGFYYFLTLSKNTKVVFESEDLSEKSSHAG